MKRKLVISILATASAIACAFGLAACGEKPHEHEYSSKVVAPTCTEGGYTVHTCACGDSYTDEQTQPTGHDWGDWQTVTAADCTNGGTQKRVCSHDSTHVETQNTSPIGHTLTHTDAKAATCTEVGNIEYWNCTVCEKYFYDSEATTEINLSDTVVAALGHDFDEPDWDWDDYESATATFTCANDSTHVETVTATDADITSEITTPVTCTTDGVKTYTATVTFDGKTYTGTNTETLTRFGHDYGEPVWTWESYGSATATFTCANDSTHVVTETATGSYITSKITTPATCTTDGVKTYTATVTFNGDTYTDTKTETLAATGHSYSNEWTSDAQYHWHAATCEHSDEIGGKAEHTWDNGYCSVCGKKDPSVPSEGLAYTLSNDETYYSVTGIGTCTDTELVIPSTYNDLPVISIGKSAFSGCRGVTNIIIPDSVTSIGSSAFSSTAYYYDKNNWENNVLYIGKHLIDADYSIDGDYIIKDGTLTISDYAFSWCSGLTSVTIPDSVKNIADYAFDGCSGLTSVTIGSGVKRVGSDAFTRCTALENVYYNGDIENWCAISFQSTDNSEHVSHPMYYASDFYMKNQNGEWEVVTEIDIPDTVTSIGKYQFRFFNNLTSITIPNSVTSIGYGAFYTCKSLTSLTIPENVTKIDRLAFAGLISLTELNYNATECSDFDSGYTILNAAGQSSSGVTVNIGANVKTIPANLLYGGYGATPNVVAVVFASGSIVESIGDRAFYGCSGLTSIEIPDSVKSIGSDAFNSCKGLTSVTIGNSVTSIGYKAFFDCSSLTSVTIGNSVTSIEMYAFSWCSSLTSVTIPDSVTSIGNLAFDYCYKLIEVKNLSSLTITAGSSSNGCVGSHAKRIYTEGESYLSTDENGYIIYDDGTDKILVGYVGTETDLTLPSGVTQIYKYAFYNCSSLTSVTIGNSVIIIGNYAFSKCSSLTSVTFNGTMQEWQAISKGKDWDYTTGNYTVTCTDGTLDKDGNVVS